MKKLSNWIHCSDADIQKPKYSRNLAYGVLHFKVSLCTMQTCPEYGGELWVDSEKNFNELVFQVLQDVFSDGFSEQSIGLSLHSHLHIFIVMGTAAHK